MARRSAHIPKTALTPRKRATLRASDFAVPSERKYPINDLFHARLALTYVLSPSNAAYRDEVVGAVLARYPELKFWWAARSRRLAAPARRKVANPSHTSEDTMPVYTLNPSHRRSGTHKASRTPSLRERVAARRNPEKKHIVLTLHDDRVTWRTSDGRTGSEPKKANFSSGPTTNALLRRLGVIKDGVFQHEAWGIDVLNEDGFPIARFRNPLSEDGVVVSNPAKRRGGSRAAQKAGLAKGQSLMAQAAAAYRAGKYPTMQAALKGVARGGAARKNPLSEDGLVVRNPAKRKAGVKRASKRTAAQSNAGKAMKLFHSGKASSLAEAWDIVRSGR